MSKRSFFLLTSLLAVAGHSMAGEFTIGKYAGEFLNLGAGSRSLGMGSAYVAIARDVSAGYWNPAGLAYLEYPEIMLMHSRQFSGEVNYDYGSVGIPVGFDKSLGFSILRVGVDGIIRTDVPRPDLALGETYADENGQLVRNTPFEAGRFGSSDYALLLTYSRRVHDRFAYGGNVKLLHRSLDDHSAWGAGFDLGLIIYPYRDLILGLNLQDITSTMVAWDTGRRELIIPALRTGFAYPIQVDFAGGRITPAFDIVARFEDRQQSSFAALGFSSVDFNFGWEYQYGDLIAFRLGSAEVGQFTAGLGLHFPKLHVDYAFLEHEALGNTHRISFLLTLEEPKFLRSR
jgi:hypothetical protein